MNDLTDLEICKRIHWIEGKRFWRGCGDFDPLTDDALCFKLMIEYGINISRYYKLGDLEAWYGAEIDLEEIEARTPNHAVCLAIIESQS